MRVRPFIAAIPLAVTGIVAPAAPAAASTTATLAAPTTIVVGTHATVAFTVTGGLVTADPTGTDITWSLLRDTGDCFLFTSGDTTGKASGSFSDLGFVQPGDLVNDCAGVAVLRAGAYDQSDDGGFDEATRAVRVLRAARWTTTDATPEPVAASAKVHVRATLDRANWNDDRYHHYTGRTATLQFRPIGGHYATVRTVTGPTGVFTASVTQKVAGCWRYAFAGSATTGPATSVGDCVKLR